VPQARCAYPLPNRPESVGRARAWVRITLTAAGREDLIDSATLIISELASNAIRHASRSEMIKVVCELDVVTLTLGVIDFDPHLPVLFAVDTDDERGRGLLLVDATADEWGSHPVGAGKIVYALLHIARPLTLTVAGRTQNTACDGASSPVLSPVHDRPRGQTVPRPWPRGPRPVPRGGVEEPDRRRQGRATALPIPAAGPTPSSTRPKQKGNTMTGTPQPGEPGSAKLRRLGDKVAAQRMVAAMLDGSGLTVKALKTELVIINPSDRDKGEVRIEYQTGHVTLKRVVREHWGLLQGYEDPNPDGAPSVGADKIIGTLGDTNPS
jgi:anti-sigma regulatory factor (Ser/Thr protein kinase)